jgi:hypothetical protein
VLGGVGEGHNRRGNGQGEERVVRRRGARIGKKRRKEEDLHHVQRPMQVARM